MYGLLKKLHSKMYMCMYYCNPFLPSPPLSLPSFSHFFYSHVHSFILIWFFQWNVLWYGKFVFKPFECNSCATKQQWYECTDIHVEYSDVCVLSSEYVSNNWTLFISSMTFFSFHSNSVSCFLKFIYFFFHKMRKRKTFWNGLSSCMCIWNDI